MKSRNQAGEAFQDLVELMDTLREQCPWDKKQTIQSLQKYSIEELYELVDAIQNEDLQEVKEELGDILFHTIFYSRIASETNDFSITDVITDVHEKLVNRHPHIFGDVKVQNEEDVKKNWEQIKLKEGKKSILSGVPKSLPAMTKAYRIQEKTSQVGFDWDCASQVLDKIQEELLELKEAKLSDDKNHIEEELGDVLFSIINYARFIGVDPEQALEKTNKKFINRFQYVENQYQTVGRDMLNADLDELEKYWVEAKQKEKNSK